MFLRLLLRVRVQAREVVVMGYARYVGRVGGLAVALGVGVAVATTPGVACAEPTDNGSSGASNPSSDSSSSSSSSSSSNSDSSDSSSSSTAGSFQSSGPSGDDDAESTTDVNDSTADDGVAKGSGRGTGKKS